MFLRPQCLQVLTQAASGTTCLAAPAADGAPGGGLKGNADGAVLTVNDFLVLSGLDNLNLFKLVRWPPAARKPCRLT